MSFILNGTDIRAPQSLNESNSSQTAQNRTLDGSISRDIFGSNKRIWTMEYINVNPTDYGVIRTIYNSYLSTADAVTWQVTEANYSISQTSVHVDLVNRAFTVKGADYISDFTLILTEA